MKKNIEEFEELREQIMKTMDDELPMLDQLLADGRRDGELKTRRADICTALEIRFGKAAAKEFAPALDAIKNRDTLTWLFRLALLSSRIKQFRDSCPKQ